MTGLNGGLLLHHQDALKRNRVEREKKRNKGEREHDHLDCVWIINRAHSLQRACSRRVVRRCSSATISGRRKKKKKKKELTKPARGFISQHEN